MKTVIVTGASSGLGLWTTKYLLDKGYQVILACRNLEKTQKAIQDFAPLNKKKPHQIRLLDLADFSSIRNFVNGLSDVPNIYALICNAGISYEGPFRYTKDGVEETFGTNYLGHFLLTHLLLEKYALERVVMVSSELHNPANKSPFEKAAFKPIHEMAYPTVDPNSSLEKQTQSFYATSKLCMVLFAYELDRRLKAKGLHQNLLINAINPGLMLSTQLGRKHTAGENLYRTLLHWLFKLLGFGDHPKDSAKAVVRLIEKVKTSAKYYDKMKVKPSSADSYDLEKAQALWEGSEAIIGRNFLAD